MLTHEDVRTFLLTARRQIVTGYLNLNVDPNRSPFEVVVTEELHEALREFMRSQYDVLGMDLQRYDDRLIICRCPVVVGDMGEAGDFLAAIALAPGDNLNRLIFADWLDERGDPWGQLIRRQVETPTAALDSARPPR